MTRITTWADWENAQGTAPATPAETALVADCRAGTACILGETRPDTPTAATRIRAPLLAYLLRGGCETCPTTEAGVDLQGAFIEDPLDLTGATLPANAILFRCTFDSAIAAQDAHLRSLILSGSQMPGMHLKRAQITGNVILRDGFDATGEVTLSGATIGGQLSSTGGRVDTATGHALNAQGAQITGPVFLSDGFHATGAVTLSGATIGGQLVCVGGRFDTPDGRALQGQGLRIDQGLIFRDVKILAGAVDLSAASVSDLVDDLDSWPTAIDALIFDGFTYERIAGGAPTDAERRLPWLAHGSVWNGQLFPQPYQHLAKVLKEMGHERDARKVHVMRRRLTARYERKRRYDAAWNKPWASLRNGLDLFWDLVLRVGTGYGYHPGRSLWFLLLLFAVATTLAHLAWEEGSMAPNAAPILLSEEWRALADDPAVANPAAAWSARGAAGQDWETFNRYAYAADVVIPIIDFGQTDAWAPSTSRGPAGEILWWARWLLSLLGWVVTGLGAAAVTGIIRRD